MSLRISLAVSLIAVLATSASGAPSPAAALQLTPIQAGVDYSKPDAATAKRCTIHSVKVGRAVGWLVKSPAGLPLRRFLDTNRDNRVDRWCYFKNGVEVYRDIDANFNGKADQYRWLGTAGTRWGLDRNEDGTIDAWKAISAEEVTAELVAAIRTKDESRFQRILLSVSELQALQLGRDHTAKIRDRLTAARRNFLSLSRSQAMVKGSTKWLHFGATRPGILPAGTDGSQRDIAVYDNVAAIIETDGTTRQLPIGTLVKSGSAWRLIGLPKSFDTGNQVTGFFFHAEPSQQALAASQNSGNSDTLKAFQALLAKLEKVDRQLAQASASDKPSLHQQQAEIIASLAKQAPRKEDRQSWRRQYVDAVSAAAQSGNYPDGVTRLESWYKQLKRQSAPTSELAYSKFRWMSSQYTLSIQKPKADFAKIQKAWIAELKQFVRDFPKADDSAEAMLQIAMAEEFSGKGDDAKKWYGRIVSDFPNKTVARKAAGAKKRLELVGKSMELRGQDMRGRRVDLAEYRGKIVAIHYWATWCKPCKQDIRELRRLQAKFASRGMAIIGVNLDNKKETVATYLRTNRIPWSQLYESGGLESRYALQYGVLTLPTMILVGKDGKVISRGIHIGQLENELESRLK